MKLSLSTQILTLCGSPSTLKFTGSTTSDESAFLSGLWTLTMRSTTCSFAVVGHDILNKKCNTINKNNNVRLHLLTPVCFLDICMKIKQHIIFNLIPLSLYLHKQSNPKDGSIPFFWKEYWRHLIQKKNVGEESACSCVVYHCCVLLVKRSSSCSDTIRATEKTDIQQNSMVSIYHKVIFYGVHNHHHEHKTYNSMF